MPILTTCTQCNTSLKAPDHLAGKLVKCPKCGTHMTVPSLAAQMPQMPPPVPAEIPAARVRPVPQRDDDFDEPPRRRRRRDRYDDRDIQRQENVNAQMGLGIASLCVGCVGAVIALIPCVGWVFGLPIAGVGLALGVVGLIIALVQKRGVAFPIAGTSVNLLAMMIVGIWYIWIARALPRS